VNEIFPWISRGVSKSTMSRLWVKKGLEYIERFRNRELGSEKFFCLMLDGLSLSEDLYAVAALGITNDGRKLMLDFQIGNSENFEVCNDLVSRLVTRGFKAEHRLYVVIDGSKSLRRAVLKYFPDAVIQRCLVHKERNLSDYLPKRYHKELSYYFKRLRIAEGAEQAQEIYKELHKFLSSKNINALKSLEECGEELIALHMINAPSSLNKTLLSTNCIENAGIHRNLWV
jgi:transposase-like protein